MSHCHHGLVKGDDTINTTLLQPENGIGMSAESLKQAKSRCTDHSNQYQLVPRLVQQITHPNQEGILLFF